MKRGERQKWRQSVRSIYSLKKGKKGSGTAQFPRKKGGGKRKKREVKEWEVDKGDGRASSYVFSLHFSSSQRKTAPHSMGFMFFPKGKKRECGEGPSPFSLLPIQKRGEKKKRKGNVYPSHRFSIIPHPLPEGGGGKRKKK